MQQTNVPFKVALGYIIVAIVLILAIGLVYRNTTTVLAINQATRDYIEKRQAADSTMSNLLKEEQTNLQQLTRAMQGKSSHNYLHEKMNSLNSGEDSPSSFHFCKASSIYEVHSRMAYLPYGKVLLMSMVGRLNTSSPI